MSVSYIPESVKMRLWGKSAGRCQFTGCNKPLWLDTSTKAEFNTAYIAHIVADQLKGPRGDPILSEQLKKDINNLMLMCDEHHRLIDKIDEAGHPVERLQAMKRQHEERVELLTSLTNDQQSHILLYGANIGQHHASVSWEKATQAMLPKWYPAEKPAMELSLKNSAFQDHEEHFWITEREQLRRQFHQTVKSRLAKEHVKHFSIFALAPQPLLIELGRLLSDIPAAEVYQLHREPPDWIWQEHPEDFDYIVQPPMSNVCHERVALNLSLSATIDNTRISNVLGDATDIWTLTVPAPHNDFMKSQKQLSLFRQSFRRLLDMIKAKHGQDNLLHLFPAVPVSVAIEIGRVWMPKADLPIRIYDQNRQVGGFCHTFDLRSE